MSLPSTVSTPSGPTVPAAVLFVGAVLLSHGAGGAAPGPPAVDPPDAADPPGTTRARSAVRCPPAVGADPDELTMTPSGRAPGASGTLRLRLTGSPTGLALAGDGSYRYRIRVEAEGLGGGPGVHHVAWAATPELDRHARLGPLGADGTVSGEVAWNKFLVFVTAEARPDPSSWSRRILLSVISPAGRMHTMAGHGPFSGEPCLDPRP